jgi:transposase InsO family protein
VPKEEIQAGNNRFKSWTSSISKSFEKNRTITGLNQVWASDITYIQLQHEHVYLAVILDLYSRKCIGWELSRNMGSQLAMSALAKALENRTTESTEGLVHHSDQGVQYASKDYVDCLKAHNILISMSRKGNSGK